MCALLSSKIKLDKDRNMQGQASLEYDKVISVCLMRLLNKARLKESINAGSWLCAFCTSKKRRDRERVGMELEVCA